MEQFQVKIYLQGYYYIRRCQYHLVTFVGLNYDYLNRPLPFHLQIHQEGQRNFPGYIEKSYFKHPFRSCFL
ncbi:hypothetical protein FGO68_gene14083 [Halteria grandinella]|uniref:Uncharacterized protein n=1 Tax=Halteria grandinella TaxID=5974 RepID=A0A8J8NAT7_HALGN|nr:hypothetical protein FGO68_gene14083 [Halteria grandinella]